MACRTGCKTKDHGSYMECLQDANVAPWMATPTRGKQSERSIQKKWDAELDAYRAARKQGIQPDGTSMAKINAAIEKSNAVGKAYGTEFNVAKPMES